MSGKSTKGCLRCFLPSGGYEPQHKELLGLALFYYKNCSLNLTLSLKTVSQPKSCFS